MSGEIIAMSDTMSMMFEPMDLLVASPATVSRCGMIYMEPEQLGWQPLLASWLASFLESPSLLMRQASLTSTAARMDKNLQEGGPPPKAFHLFDWEKRSLQLMFDWLVEPCLCLVRRELTEMSPTVDTNLVVSLINLLECQLETALKGTVKEGDEDDPDKKTKELRMTHIECCFIFSLIWSIGASGTGESQKKFTAYLAEIMSDITHIDQAFPGVLTALQLRNWAAPDWAAEEIQDLPFKEGKWSLPLPTKGDFWDYLYDPEAKKWDLWTNTLQPLEISEGTPFSQIVVPTSYTAQFSWHLRTLLTREKAVLVCGPTGTGKSAYVNNTLYKELDQTKYKPLCQGFSAKTTANMTQNIVDGKLDKRRKGVYGPPVGFRCLLFVDDLNMPEVEEYGAQPPVELLRQLIDCGGWYDLEEMSWRQVVDTTLLAAMGPPGGGRNHLTPRILRHFNLLCFTDFDDPTLVRIFTAVSKWHFESGFSGEVAAAVPQVVAATLATYRAAMAELLPTPRKSHYTFNLRDFARVVQGMLMHRPDTELGKDALVRLWTHEALRVFGDRLIDDADRDWFVGHVEQMCVQHFGVNFKQTFKHVQDEDGAVDYGAMRRIFFGDYMPDERDDNAPYAEIQDLSELSRRMEEYLVEYNGQSRSPMNLVLFMFAIEHVSRIARVLKMPGGNALLVGVGGSGRQSLARLATHMMGYNIKQIEISKNYTTLEWREDLKAVIRGSGTGQVPLVFLFSDTQIKQETFVEDINNMLNSGEVPNLFPNDEKMQICEAARPFAKQKYGKKAQDMNNVELFAFFIERVRQNMHVVLAFSPIGDAFRDRLRKFPSLINCCAIDWFTAWPEDALQAVASKFLADVNLGKAEAIRGEIVAMCRKFHVDASKLSERFLGELGRVNYVTPTSYLELILAFKKSLAEKRAEVQGNKNRYLAGLEQLEFATQNVNGMQVELENLKPQLVISGQETEKLMAVIQSKLPGVETKRAEVTKDAEAAEAEAAICKASKDEVEADLAEAIPALNAAVAALDQIKPAEINEVKNLAKPPATVKLVAESICVMLEIKSVRIPDPNDPSRRIMDYWGPSQKMMQDNDFINKLKGYDKDNIPLKVMKNIRENYITNEAFTPANAEKASKAAAGLCKWVYAMEVYDRVAKEVAPKKEALRVAEEQLEFTMGQLRAKQAELKAVEDDLQALQDEFEGANRKKGDLGDQVELCNAKLVRATQLIDGLGGEKARWEQLSDELGVKYDDLTGDVLVSAGVMAYLGPFTANFRGEILGSWIEQCKAKEIPCSESPTLNATLGNQVTIRQWNIDGLPTDGFSIDNGIIIFNARRWPLMIDPQGQANKWIRNMEKDASLHVIKFTDADYMRTLENAVQFGQPVLLENVGEELDPSLEPLLLKQVFKQGGVNMIRLGDQSVEYADSFRFYVTTKLRNPHYLPEISVKVTLLNFMITPEGLEDQLLGFVVSRERPDLEDQKNKLIVESAANRKKLSDIENEILHILNQEGNILEDEAAISTLNNSKVLSDEIKQKQEVADKTEKEIDTVRNSYSPVAYASQILFFCIADLANIEPVYQYSLSWFIQLFNMSIEKSEKSKDVTRRLKNLEDHFTYALYCNVCRSLLEKDKLLFSFVLSIRILKGGGKVNEEEWLFLLTGGVGMDNPHPNPCPDWLSTPSWDLFCRLDHLPAFSGMRDQFASQQADWRAIYDDANPHQHPLPGDWAYKLHGIQKLCALRCVRPDKLCLGVLDFVQGSLGQEFVKPPPFDLGACYDDSSPVIPLVFILSPGSDPMSAIVKAAGNLNLEVNPVSLGQGQGPVAERMIDRGQIDGSWVVLQNCHLAPSWMTSLERITEGLLPDTCHANFRLWCTTYPSDVFPVSVLQNGIKMTIEPPKGLRANLLGSYVGDPISDPEFFSSCTKGLHFRRLLYAMCFFHALVQERRLFGPLGWNIPYEFNNSDLKISVQQLAMFLDENDEVPFKALRYCVGECNYGGRVTDDKDRRCLHSILNRLVCPEALEEGSPLSPSGTYVVPPDGSHQAYMEFVDTLPLVVAPEVFGLHENANISKDNNDTNNLFNSILSTENGSGGGSSSQDDTISTVAADILQKMPAPFDMEEAQLKYPVTWSESMNTVLCQELLRFNNLNKAVVNSLKNIRKAVKGLVVMSAELEVLGNSLFFGRIPALWKAKSYPSLKPLASYVTDLLARLAFFQDWLDNKPPSVYWVSGFFFTQAFLTGANQNFARKYTVPIDNVDFDFEMMKEDAYKASPRDGVYVYGLFLEGARWDKHAHSLVESMPKVLFSPSPIIWFKPCKKQDLSDFPRYDCPVYKTSDRRGVLATTGHSSNFICFIPIPSDKPQDHWVQRGVAMLSQLDD